MQGTSANLKNAYTCSMCIEWSHSCRSSQYTTTLLSSGKHMLVSNRNISPWLHSWKHTASGYPASRLQSLANIPSHTLLDQFSSCSCVNFLYLIFSLTSSMALLMAVSTSSVCIQVCQQLLDGLPKFVQTVVVPRAWILLNFVIPWLLL